jgi:dienelactone hydrolase
MNPYTYIRTEPQFDIQLRQTTDKWLHYAVKFQVARPTRYEENNVAYGDYYQPRKGSKWPLAILVHGWGDRSILPCKMLARDLTKKGIACFILYLVFHQMRMPSSVIERLPNLTSEEWFEGYQTSVIDIRQIIDWASENKEIDEDRIAVIGISLGGIITAITMGVDTRITAGVITVAGGKLSESDLAEKNRARPDRSRIYSITGHLHAISTGS